MDDRLGEFDHGWNSWSVHDLNGTTYLALHFAGEAFDRFLTALNQHRMVVIDKNRPEGGRLRVITPGRKPLSRGESGGTSSRCVAPLRRSRLGRRDHAAPTGASRNPTATLR